MKKSKFLQSSKDMLSRSFNPAKCKTSLRLAGSRLKLLRNKKEVQVKQMKREISQLLESGQDQTARIRVEHVIREEKMMAAYDLIEIYCELIVARLSIIESQKNCPIDLKEAIASVVFASPRCGDVPELLDVKKQFAAKYGKDFITVATELRPECGVSRLLVEKLSAVAPDGPTKIKILSAIAEEHSVNWDPNAFDEKHSNTPNDLLSGPSTFGNGSKLPAEPPISVPDIQAPINNNKMHSSPLNFSPEKTSSPQNSGSSKTLQPITRPPAFVDEREQLYQEERKSFSSDTENSIMGFKDAMSAAQAAAESAERASMAARAAAELSNRDRLTRQYSTESHKSGGQNFRDEKHEKYETSRFNSKQSPRDSSNSSSKADRKKSRASIGDDSSDHDTPVVEEYTRKNFLKEDTSRGEMSRGGKKRYNESASLKSKPSKDDLLDHDTPVVEEYTRKNSIKKDVSRGEMSRGGKKKYNDPDSSKSKASINYDPSDHETYSPRSEMSTRKQSFKNETLQEERFHRKNNSSRSDSNISDDANIFANPMDQKSGYDVVKDPIATSHGSDAVFFDKSDSDNDDQGFDTGPTYDDRESEYHWSKSPEHLSINTDSWSPKSTSNKIVEPSTSSLFTRKNSSPDKFVNSSETDHFTPVTFDDSEGPTSGSDEEPNVSRHSKQSVRLQVKDNSRQSLESPLKGKVRSKFNRKQLSVSSDDELEGEEIHMEKKRSESIDIGESLSPPKSEGLHLGKLRGGLRHTGYNVPPFLVNRVDESSASKKITEETSAKVIISTAPPKSPKLSTVLDHKKSPRAPYRASDSDSDSSEEEEQPIKKSPGQRKELYSAVSVDEVKTKSSSGGINSFFLSDNSDLEDESPKKSPLTTKKSPLGWKSRRTKTPSSDSSPKTKLRPESLDSDAGVVRKPSISTTSVTSLESESPKKPPRKFENYKRPPPEKVVSKPVKSNLWGPPEQPTSPKLISKPVKSIWDPPEQPNSPKLASKPSDSSLSRKPEKVNSEKSTPLNVQKSKVSREPSSDAEPPSIQRPKIEASASTESPKANSSKDESAKKASHVHPKLPDYDNIFQTFGMKRT